jgi:hypothetical protein
MTTENPLRVVEKSDDLTPAPPAPTGRQPVTVALTVPIEAHGDTLTTLTLRPLRVEDIVELPMDIMNRAKVDPRVINDLLVRVAGIPLSSVKQLDPGDWFECMMAVVGFFGKQARAS